MKNILIPLVMLIGLASCQSKGQTSNKKGDQKVVRKVVKSDKEWKSQLTEMEYYVLREKGTEMAGTGKYNKHKGNGVYRCAGCDHPLFHSDTKFDSGTGWPSYFEPFSDSSLTEHEDRSYGWNRTEVVCARCDGHLGHVFNDGPQPTGLRYCINSVSLRFEDE